MATSARSLIRRVVLGSLLWAVAPLQAAEPGLSPQALATHNRALALMGQFRFDEAETLFRQLATDRPGEARLAVNRAIALMNRQREGDEARALALLDAVLEQHPASPRARYNAGLLHLRAGEGERAAALLRQVTAADPDDAHAHYFLAQALEQVGEVEAALGHYRRAMLLDPYLRSAYYGTFMLLRRHGERAEARAMVERYQELAANPRAHLAEFKYTRMGPKSAAVALGAETPARAPRPEGPLFLAPQAVAEVEPDAVGPHPSLSVVDVDGDGTLDLFLAGAHSRVLLGGPGGAFRIAEGHPLAGIPAVNAATWGELDNDGRLAAYLCRDGENRLFRRGADGWEENGDAGVGGGARNTVDCALFDADHDGDLDLFLVNADGPDELFNNNLNGSFRPLAEAQGIGGGEAPSRGLLVTDVDRDRDADLVLLKADRAPLLYENDLLWRYRTLEHAIGPAAAGVAADRDVDGYPELYLWRDGVVRWERTADGWTSRPLGRPDATRGVARMRMALADVDGDGTHELLLSHADGWGAYRIGDDGLEALFSADLPGIRTWTTLPLEPARGPAVVALEANGRLTLWRPGPGRHPFLTLAFSGRQQAAEQMRSNASGIGTVAALRVGSRWSGVVPYRTHSGPGQDLRPQALGLGGAATADFVAITWSDGVFQTELDLAAGQAHRIEERQRQLASCPVLFAWDGERWAFVTDLLGVGGIGFAVGPGEYAEPRPWENLLLPVGLARPRDGHYRLKLGEPMEEALYLDAARLVAYDLPPGWSMVLDERMGIAGPQPTGEALFYRREVVPARAIDRHGATVTDTLLRADGRAAPLGEVDPRFVGLMAQEQRLTVELSEPVRRDGAVPVLVLDGWVEYPYSQTSFAAWQAGAGYLAPSLEVRLADGRWQSLREQFGYPAGMPRRMALPLPELPEGVTALRLSGNMEVYWDRIALAYAEPLPQARRRALPLTAAEQQENGFAARATLAQRRPHYDYARRAPLWDTRHMAGAYTRFGPVEPLLAAVDDAVAIVGPGEEVELAFTDTAPPLPPGWSRRLVLESHGWAKDMDLYTRDGATLAPLPVRGAAPDPRRDALHRRFNTRYEAGY